MTKKLNVTRMMYKRQVLSSHTENARVVVMNIYQADECKSCEHKTINCCSVNVHTETAPGEDIMGTTVPQIPFVQASHSPYKGRPTQPEHQQEIIEKIPHQTRTQYSSHIGEHHQTFNNTRHKGHGNENKKERKEKKKIYTYL
jgi:hypothetical protein